MATVRGFVPLLCQVIEFGAMADAALVLYAVNGLPELLDARLGRRVAAGFLDPRRIENEGRLHAQKVTAVPDPPSLVDLRRPEIVITDAGSYSDVVFGLLQLLGFDYRPQLAALLPSCGASTAPPTMAR